MINEIATPKPSTYIYKNNSLFKLYEPKIGSNSQLFIIYRHNLIILRNSSYGELIGNDVSKHGRAAYPIDEKHALPSQLHGDGLKTQRQTGGAVLCKGRTG